MSQKPNIMLDLDGTMIYADPTEDYDFKKNEDKAKNFKYHDMDGYYIVFERPGVQKFLDWLFKNYNVSVWTAASKDYALFVIDKVILKDKSRKLDFILFSYHCDVSSSKKKGTKDLTTLGDVFGLPGYDADNTIILDDYNEVHRTQPGNCIIARAFDFNNSNSENDGFLPALKPHLETLKSDVEAGKSVKGSVPNINNSMKNNRGD